MVGVEYGNGKVGVTFSRSKNKSSSSCGSIVVVVILLSDFIQPQITLNGNKTANIYVKTVQFIYSVRVTLWL